MSVFCSIVGAIGLQIASCQSAPPPIDVPGGDTDAFAHLPRPAPPPAPKEIVRETVRIETVYVPTEIPPEIPPTPPPPVPTQPPVPVQPPAADPDIEAAAASVARAYQARRAVRLGDPSKVGDWRVSFDAAGSGTADIVAPLDQLALPRDLSNLGARDQAARFRAPGLQSGLPVDNARILAADRYIAGVLESSINTQLSGDGQGSVVIQTSRDIFGYHGRNILLPKGSRLVCDYQTPETIGETRIAISCGRVLTAGVRAEIYETAAAVGDAQGRAGITGDVDNRFWRRYGTAFLLSGVSAAVRGVTASVESSSRDVADILLDESGKELAERFGEITASVLQETISLQPVVSIPQGTRVQIRPANDWYVAKPL